MRPASTISRVVAGLILFVAIAVAYHNSLRIPFVFDDLRLIANNPNIRSLWPVSELLTSTSRPLVQLSLAINYAIGGDAVIGYHLFNLGLHVLSALTVLALLRRAFAAVSPSMGDMPALMIALLWAVHPLLTQPVNYVIQRGELLMSLFYVLTLYGVARVCEATGDRRWTIVAIVSCALGMASKPVMVTAPVVAFLFDALVLSRSWRTALRERWPLYAGLAATWLVLPLVLANATAEWKGSAGIGVASVTHWQYALTQAQVVAHYLRLAVWPVGFCFDYAWPPAGTMGVVWPGLVLMSTLLVGTLVAAVRRSALGFLGVWFFLILAPTSSFLPIQDIAVEHRMYLPLLAPVALVVLAITRYVPRVAIPSLAGLAVVLCVATVARNYTYQTGERLWRDTVAKSPHNARAYTNLGNAVAETPTRLGEAIECYATALRVHPSYHLAHYNWARALAAQGDLAEAQRHYEAALALQPTDSTVRYNLALTLARQGKLDEAVAQFTAVVESQPTHVEAQYNIGVAQEKLGQTAASQAAYRAAIARQPRFAKAHYFLALSLARSGDAAAARQHFDTAVSLSAAFAQRTAEFESALRANAPLSSE